MTSSYINQGENDKKYTNMDPKSSEYQKHQDELMNTMKMSTILKSLNSPKKKRKTIQVVEERVSVAINRSIISGSTNNRTVNIKSRLTIKPIAVANE